MKINEIKDILEKIKEGTIDVEEGVTALKDLPFKDLGYAKIDEHRELRNGYPEVIFCEGKESAHVIGIVNHMLKKETNILLTRVSEELYEALGELKEKMEYHLRRESLSLNGHL